MRLDKFLKVSRIVKRRTVANEICDAKKVMINQKVARASQEVKENDIITISFGGNTSEYRILKVVDAVTKEAASSLFEKIE